MIDTRQLPPDLSGVKLELVAASKTWGRSKALDDVSLVIEPGESLCLVGLNGAGKTTMLQVLAGLTALQKGDYLVNGKPLRKDQLDVRREILFVPDLPMLFGHESVLNNIGMYLQLFGKSSQPNIEEKVNEWMDKLGILSVGAKAAGHLSRGQYYKAGLVALFAVDPEIWLLDEPFASGMDPLGIERVQEEISVAVAERRRTVVFSTQILEIAQRVANRICVLNEGAVAACGAPTELHQWGKGIGTLLCQLQRQDMSR